MRFGSRLALSAAIALTVACGALGAEAKERARLVGARSAVAHAQWRATLVVRPAPRSAPHVSARNGRASVAVRVRRAAAGRYSLTAAFPSAGRWLLSTRLGAGRRTLGTVVVAAPAIRLRSVYGLALQPDGGVLIADGDGRRIVRLDPATGRMTTFSASSQFSGPTDVEVARDGAVYVADRLNDTVFRIRNGTATRFADYGAPLTVAVDSTGAVYAAGRANTVVRIDSATRTAARYAGTGAEGSSGNGGPALGATLMSPHGIAVDPNDNLVVAELMSVRRVDRATGVIGGIAGTGRDRGLCGERGPALAVCLTALRIAFEPDGDLWIADPENVRLWRVSGGEARAFAIGFPPYDVAVEAQGTVLVADHQNRRVHRFDPATGRVTRIAG